MKKAEETKLRNGIKKHLNDNKINVVGSEFLIDDLINWLKLDEFNNEKIEDSAVNGDSIGWNLLTTKSMCSKTIQSIFEKLNCTPQLMAKKKIEEKKVEFDLQKFLNEK